MISLEDAKERILAAIPPLPAGPARIEAALGRICAAPAAAAVDLPPFDNSAMDGYAVRSEELRNASASGRVSLRQVGRIGAGESFPGGLAAGQCLRLFTGSPLPRGADAVVMQEDVLAEGGVIQFSEPAKPFENIRLQGEDVRAGEVLAEPGDRLDSSRLALLAAAGCSSLSVFPRPALALLATGSELREPGSFDSPLGPAEIFESNRLLLAGLIAEAGGRALPLPIVRDDLAATVERLREAFAAADAVITTGGVSVGEFDFVKEAFARLGGVIEIWKIAMRPGKPFVFGRLGGKFLFGLPGNPMSALVTFLLLVRPAILRMQGARRVDLPQLEAVLAEPILNRGDRRHFVRVHWENGIARPAGPQASHRVSSLALANGLVDAPPGSRLEAGTKISVQIWRGL